MQDIIFTLIYSVVMLVIMIYPAMKIVEYADSKFDISESLYNKLTVITTIVLAILCGAFLRFI